MAQQLPGQGTAFFQIIHADTVGDEDSNSRSCLSHIHADSLLAVFANCGNIDDDKRKIWVHTLGYSSHGEI